MDRGLWTERGQVLIEFALAAAGIVAIAFVIARTGQWLNESMVQRNENFQTTRIEAGQSNSLVRFREPSPINLIGPGARRTGGVGPQPPGTRPAPCRPVVDGVNLLSRAQTLRSIANGMLAKNNEWKLQTQQNISARHARAKQLIDIANRLLSDKELVDNINRQIPPYETAIRDLYAGTTKIKLCSGVAPCKEYTFANADLLDSFMKKYGLDVDRLINAWWEVDQELASLGPLNTTISDYSDRIKELKKLVTMINDLLWNDADGPDGTQYAYPIGVTDRIKQITTRITQIDKLLLDDADGGGLLTLGINELITMIEGIPSNGLNDGWLEQIRNEEVFPCVTDPSCDADLLQLQMLVLEFVLSGSDTHGITKIEEFIADIDAQLGLGSCTAGTPCYTRLSTAQNILTLMLNKSTATESYGLKDLGEALEFERNEKDYQVPGVDIPALDGTPGLPIAPETVDGLEAEKRELEERRDSLTAYRDNTLKPRIQVLTDEMAPYVAERKLLQQIDGHWNPWKGQAQIEGLEAVKQNIRTTWCRNTDIAVSHARGTCGLDCATVKPSAPLWQAVDAWRASLGPLSTDPTSLAADPDSGQLACMAHQVKAAADAEFQKANDLVEGGLPVDTETIQGLLDEAEALERQARDVCASM